MTLKIKHIYEFGPFHLDTAERLLQRDGSAVALTPKAFEVLLLLVERSGRIVGKDELLNQVWADSFVEEGNLKVTVSMLRKALEDGAGDRQYIETIPRRGYRFVASVKESFMDEADIIVREMTKASVTIEESEEQGKVLVPANRKRKRSAQVVVACVALVGVVIAGAYLWTNRLASGAEIKSIAVLPFKAIVADSRDESLEMGIADTLITKLSNLSHLTVRPISAVYKYSSLEQDALAAGREQRVDAVLDGSIRKVGDKIRVTVRLLRVRDGRQLWADQLDEKFTDILAVEDAISRQVVSVLEVKLSGEERELVAKRYTSNSEAYQLYVKGRYLWNKRTAEDLRKSIEYFNLAIAIDPNYALAYVGLADAYAVLPSHTTARQEETLPKAKAAVQKALDIDSQLPEAHITLASLSADEWDWAEADRRFKRALELNPNYATAHQWYGEYLVHVGRVNEAMQEFKRAQELDPTSLIINSLLGEALYLEHRYDEAIEQHQKTLEMDANFAVAHFNLGLVYLQKNLPEEAKSEFEKAVNLRGDATNLLALLGVAYAKSGDKSSAQNVLDTLNKLVIQKRASPHDLAIIYTGLGDKDQALKWLEKAYQERSWLILKLKTDPFFDPLRSDPRFASLVQRMNMPQ